MALNRRGFMKFLGLGVAGIAVEQAIPLGRVWSFPKEIVVAQPISVRFIRAWNLGQNLMWTRIDVCYGFGKLELPKAVESAIRYDLSSPKQLDGVLPPEALANVKNFIREGGFDNGVIKQYTQLGVQYPNVDGFDSFPSISPIQDATDARLDLLTNYS